MRASASAPRRAPASRTSTSAPPPAAAAIGLLGGLPHDGEDRALDRLHHRAVGGLRRPVEGGRDHRGVGRLVAAVAQHLDHAPQDLGEDDAGVAAGAHERAVADGLARRRQVIVGPVELLAHRAQGERHVRARVAVGNGIDVEPVDHLAVGGQGIAVADDQRPGGQLASRRSRAGIPPDRRGMPCRSPDAAGLGCFLGRW